MTLPMVLPRFNDRSNSEEIGCTLEFMLNTCTKLKDSLEMHL